MSVYSHSRLSCYEQCPQIYEIISDLNKKLIQDYILINKIGSQIDLINQLSSSILNEIFRQYEPTKEA